MTTSIRKRVCLFAACAVLSTSAIALADGTPTGGGQDPPTPPPPPGHDALLVPQVDVVDALVQALPVLIQTLGL
ncbi:MAG: hypothetical protein U0167_06835 [bacterium]